jgi:hypothetical protein
MSWGERIILKYIFKYWSMKLRKVCQDKVKCPTFMKNWDTFGSMKAANCKTSSEILSSSERKWIVFCGGVRLNPLCTSATNWPILSAPVDIWRVWSSRWNENWQGKLKYSEETCPSATLFTTNPTWPDLGSNRASAVGSLRLTAWAMARPRKWNSMSVCIRHETFRHGAFKPVWTKFEVTVLIAPDYKKHTSPLFIYVYQLNKNTVRVEWAPHTLKNLHNIRQNSSCLVAPD